MLSIKLNLPQICLRYVTWEQIAVQTYTRGSLALDNTPSEFTTAELTGTAEEKKIQ